MSSNPATVSGYIVQSLDKARNELISQYACNGTWRKVAKVYGNKVPAGTLCAIAKGREPKKPAHRAALGLPALAPAPVCQKCGVVHTAKRCTANSDKPRPRRAINLADAASAADTIRRHASAEFVAELAEMLSHISNNNPQEGK